MLQHMAEVGEGASALAAIQTVTKRAGGSARHEPSAEVIAWRRRALDQQLPAAAFPAGSGAPSLVFLWATMVLAALAVVGFAVYDTREVPGAVGESQRDLVLRVARNINLSSIRAATELDTLIAGFRRPPAPPDAELLSRVVGERETWAGAAIVETATRRVIVTNGVPIPAELLPTALPPDATVVVATTDGPALVRIAGLDGTRTLLAMQPLLMRNLRLNPDARHGVFMVTPDGKETLMQGVSAVDGAQLPVVFRDLAGLESSRIRSVGVREWPDERLVIAAAPIGETGVVVVSMVVARVAEGTDTLRGLLLAGTLLAVALLSFQLMRWSLVRPMRALLRQAKADACGARTDDRRSLRIAEAYRIAHALAVSSGSGLRARRWRPTAMQGLVGAAVIALLWPVGAVAATLDAPTVGIPDQLRYDEESRAEATSVALGNALDTGLRTVTRISIATQGAAPDRVADALSQGLTEDHRLRGLYLVDRDGKLVRSAGRPSLRSLEPVPGDSGVVLDRAIRRLPVLYAYRLASDGSAIVGEFDIDYLLRLVRQADGRVRVVDAQLRTILDSEGYRAFQPMTGRTAHDAAVQALPGATVGRAQAPDGSPVLIAAAGLVEPPSVAHLEWAVVVERNVFTLQLPGFLARRQTYLLAGAMAGIVLLTFAWHYFIFVRPLRRLAAAADRIRAGSFEEPVTPQRHDDIGAVAMCLEVCRQVRHTGSARFGGAVRLRGSEDDYTAVLPRLPWQRRADKLERV